MTSFSARDDISKASDPPSLAAASNIAGRSLTILVVDDDALISTNTAVLLEDLGHVVIEAGSGAEALDCVRECSDIELVITDQMMPFMTGSELILAVRAQHKDMPVVLASGYGESLEDDLGVVRLTKPFGQADLQKAISEAVGRGAIEPRS